MKVKELMSWLSKVDPEAEIHFQFGESDIYRLVVARMIAEEPKDIDPRESCLPMLEHLDLAAFKYVFSHNEVTVTFEQGFIQESEIRKRITNVNILKPQPKKPMK